MVEGKRRPTPQGKVILERLEELSLSIAEVERRTPLTKNTITNAIYGPRLPQRKTIEILAEVLELPVGSLTRPRTPRRRGPRSPTFGAWLWRLGNLSLWIGLVGALLTADFLYQSLKTGSISPAVQITHFAVILILLTQLPRLRTTAAALDDEPVGHRIAFQAAGDFRRYWGAVWIFWLFLYLALSVTAALGLLPTADTDPGTATRWSVVVLNLFQNGATVLLLLCYEVVARPTIEEDLTRRRLLPTEAWLAFALLVSLLEAGTVLFGIPWSTQQWFGWLSGFAQGTALALLVGRMDSKYVEPPTVVIALLYLYAAIQGAWPVFQYHYELMLILTFVALVLKCLLFLFVSWLFDSRILLFYLSRMRALDAEVREDRSEFLGRLQ